MSARNLVARRALARKARGDLGMYLNCLHPRVFGSAEEAELAALGYLINLRCHVDALAELNAGTTGYPVVTS